VISMKIVFMDHCEYEMDIWLQICKEIIIYGKPKGR